MSNFETIKEQKERQIEQLTKDLQDIKQQLRLEKRRLDETEDQEDQLGIQRDKLIAELDELDEEFDRMDGDADQDDDILIEKLEQEAEFLNDLLDEAEEQYEEQQEEMQRLERQNKTLELDNQALEKKLKGVVDMEAELANLQKNLTASLDEEKQLFDQNLKLLNQLKDLEQAQQETSKQYSQKENFLHTVTDQTMIERRSRTLEHNIKEFSEKIEGKAKQFQVIKWKIEKAVSMISESEIMKITGLEAFQQKVDKFNIELKQIINQRDNISTKKQSLNSQIQIKDIKLADKTQINQQQKQHQDLEQELDQLILRENDVLDVNRLLKSYNDLERDTETEYLRKCKTLKDTKQQKILTLIQDNAINDVQKFTNRDVRHTIKHMLYELYDYETQKELHIQQNIAILQNPEDEDDETVLIANNPQSLIQANKDIKFYYQLQFIQEFKKFAVKAEMKVNIQNKLKKINDNITELDKLMQQNSNNLDNLQKEASYIKESEFSPVKGRVSVIYGVKGDLEKENEVQIQNRQIEQQVLKFEAQKLERDKLKKLLKQYQQKFDDLELENSNLVKFEELIDEVNTDLDYKTEELKNQVKTQNEEIRQIEHQVQERTEKFQKKRQILAECRHEEKDKRQDILKCEAMALKIQSRIDKIDKDLKSQTAGLALAEDKQNALNQDLRDIQGYKAQMQAFNKEIDNQKQLIHQHAQELNSIGDKIVTLDQLKSILGQLQELRRLKQLQEEMKALGDLITMKELAVEQFISDVLGGSLFDCERKFKEAEALVDKLSKKLIEANNGLNDFELDIKKGLHLYQTDDDLNKEGKRLQEENLKDRKDLKGLEDQKNLIRKVLHKIKNALNEQEQLKTSQSSAQKLTAATLEEYINEIETCVRKCESQEREIASIEGQIDKRKEIWNKLMFKGSAKEALIDDIDKAIKDNTANIDQLKQKKAEIDKLIKGLEDVSKAMENNPDYELRKASIKKIQDALEDYRKRRDEIANEIKSIDSNIQKLKDAKDKGLGNLSLEVLQQHAKLSEDTSDQITKLAKKTDLLLRDLIKKRQKVSDADIQDNYKNRIEGLNQLENHIKDIEREQAELEKIIQEASKVSGVNINDSMNKINEIKKDIAKTMAERDQLKQRLNALKDQLKVKDLFRDDPSSFIPIINELADLRHQLQDKENKLNIISKSIKFLKNKHGGVDMEKKFQQFAVKASNLASKLQSLLEDQEVLKELFEEFDGYTSDTQEEDFIDRLGIEINEIATKHKIATELNEKLIEKVEQAQKNISRTQEQLNTQEIERRAQQISEIEEEAYVNEKLVDDVSYRIGRNKKVFQNMPVLDKLGRREQEILELSKRLVQFDNQLNEIDIDIQQEIYQLRQSSPDDKALPALEQIVAKMAQVKQDYQKPGLSLNQLNTQVQQLKNTENYHQFDLLKQNIRIKKQILANLNEIKQIRILFNQLKVDFDNNKPKKQIVYKAIKGDYVDQLLADWINNNNCPVPISRLGNGFYMFGSKKIYAKILNGKLLIRVGGGYMGIDEFMFYYGAQELNRMLAYEDFENEDELDLDQVVDPDVNRADFYKHFADGKSVIGAQQFKKRLSPRPGASPKPGSPRTNAGSKRSMASPRGSQGPSQHAPSPRSNVNKSPSKAGNSVQSNRSNLNSAAGRKSPNPGSFLKASVNKMNEERKQ